MGAVRIVWVKANKLLPLHSGGDIRSFNLLRQLTRRHEVVLFSYYDGTRDSEYESEIERQLPGSICVSTSKQESAWMRGLDYVLRFPTGEPYAISRFSSTVVRERLWECLSQRQPDLVVADFLDAAVNLPRSLYSSSVPLILFQHNVESEIWRRHSTNGSSAAMRLIYGLECTRMARYEQATVKKFHHVIAVSDHDKKLMSAWVPVERITVVPTGVDTELYRPGDPSQEKPLVVFVGAMDWEPNVDAVKFFCTEIWPAVLQKVPQAHFRIVGRNPDRRVAALAGDSVEVTGRVPSVVDHLREAAVVVVPLRIGGGTRLKIYEAMAVGKAVVSTSVGAEGLDVHSGKDVMIADSPGIFADSVIRLLQNSEARRLQGAAAATLARKYSWQAVGETFTDTLEQVVSEYPCANSPRPALTTAVMEG